VYEQVAIAAMDCNAVKASKVEGNFLVLFLSVREGSYFILYFCCSVWTWGQSGVSIFILKYFQGYVQFAGLCGSVDEKISRESAHQ
jgi:hypothetical protein